MKLHKLRITSIESIDRRLCYFVYTDDCQSGEPYIIFYDQLIDHIKHNEPKLGAYIIQKYGDVKYHEETKMYRKYYSVILDIIEDIETLGVDIKPYLLNIIIDMIQSFDDIYPDFAYTIDSEEDGA